MGNPDKGFAGKAVTFAITALSAIVLLASTSAIAHAKTVATADKDNEMIVPPHAVPGEPEGKYQHRNSTVKHNPQNPGVSRDGKFYKPIASPDLADPVQVENLLPFMDTRVAERELHEEVKRISKNRPEAKSSTLAFPAAREERAKGTAERARPLEPRRAIKPGMKDDAVVFRATMPAGTMVAQAQEPPKITKPEKLDMIPEPQAPRSGNRHKASGAGNEEKSVVDKEKEQEREARAREGRQVGERTRQKAQGPKPAEERRSAKQKSEKAEQVKQASSNSLPGRTITYQIASEQNPGIINFDQAITRRFKVAGSYLDKGEHGNNIVKDQRGREFMNFMVLWDVLVEPRSDGENYYYGSIQFPLGSRHPAIIKSTVPGDEIAQGCKANEVLVLKGFETEGIDYTHGLMDAYLAHSIVMPDGTIAFQEEVHQPSFSLINAETGCMSRDVFSRRYVDQQTMGYDKILQTLPVRE